MDREAGTADGAAGGAELTREGVLGVLNGVVDPELGVGIVDLGLVYDVGIDGAHVQVTYTLTSMGCPIGPLIQAQMEAAVVGLPGVSHVEFDMVFSPAWTPEMMSEEAKAALGWF